MIGIKSAMLGSITVMCLALSCDHSDSGDMSLTILQTSADGDKLTIIHPVKDAEAITDTVVINSTVEFQTITGFGGAFTESSAYVLNKLSPRTKHQVMAAYFSDSGAQYSLTRTHMNSCDFSLNHYSYTPMINDTTLESFSISEDTADLIPMIKQAQALSTSGFKIIASPWTASPWMKDNNHWYGGKLLKRYYKTWATTFVKYAEAYAKEGIPIWAFTVENEPLGNDEHWESMHFTPNEMADFVKNHLGPQLKDNNIPARILVYDQNRGPELEEWASVLLNDDTLKPYIYGTAVHWYTSTNDWFPASLQHTHNLAPNKSIIHTEGCIDSEVPHWNDDAWYWEKEATDWGYEWASQENKKYHPKYVPCYRYARDIIGCMNNWIEGWVDWNMVLDRSGGPNLAQNWCIAPIIADTKNDEVYITPLYYVLSHFSKYIRPNAVRIGVTQSTNKNLHVTAARNEDGSKVVVLFNESENPIHYRLDIDGHKKQILIKKKAIQTIFLKP